MKAEDIEIEINLYTCYHTVTLHQPDHVGSTWWGPESRKVTYANWDQSHRRTAEVDHLRIHPAKY